MEAKQPIKCYFTLHGINYKNGFVTSCPQNPDQLFRIEKAIKPSEIFNSEGFRNHRLEMMSGKWSSGCHLCKEPESIGSTSMRQDYEPDMSLYIGDPRETNGTWSLPGESYQRGLKHVEIRFGNSCNMACRHCSTVYSSGWISKLKFYQPDEEVKFYDLKQLLRTEHRSSEDDKGELEISLDQVKEIVDDLCEYAIGLEKVEFAGGEVLNQKQFFYFLKLLASHPNADKLFIGFHTNFNANFNPKELSELLEPFAMTIIHISVDAGTNIYPYFRTGDWEKLKDNIDTFRSVASNKKMHLTAVITTSAYQMMDLPNIFNSLLQLDFVSIDASMVYSPIYLNPALMNVNFKDYLIQDFLEVEAIINQEQRRRILANELGRLSYNGGVFRDIEKARTALNDIKTYSLNTDLGKVAKDRNLKKPGLNGWEIITNEQVVKSFETYVRKTDEIWKQNFNDYMVNYKLINGKIERVKNV